MNKYTIKANKGVALKVDRHSDNELKFTIGNEEAVVFTEDLAALLKQELPKDRAMDLFAEIEEKEISTGKVRVGVEVKEDLKRGEKCVFTFDINRYMDTINKKFTGVRVNPTTGIIY